MKRALAVSNILSWINLIICAGFVLLMLMAFFLYPAFQVLFSIILMGSVALHSYAALQLRKSILNPTIPLSKQTPTGIRLMGYISLFAGMLLFGDGIYGLLNTNTLIAQTQVPDQFKQVDFVAMLRGFCVFFILLGLSIILNVILNIRLLKWYMILLNANRDNG